MFNLEQARKDGNIARGLIYRGRDDDGQPIIRWSTVSILSGPNQHNQYQVMALSDSWYATTDRLTNISPAKLAQTLGFEVVE